jgi:hypothetical protein
MGKRPYTFLLESGEQLTLHINESEAICQPPTIDPQDLVEEAFQLPSGQPMGDEDQTQSNNCGVDTAGSPGRAE